MTRSELVVLLAERFPQLVQKDAEMAVAEPHAHEHVHAPLSHRHPHYPDLHHRHRH